MTPEWYQSFLTLQLIDNFSQEKNTWRVIGRLYHDRLSNNGDEEAMDTDADNAVSALVLRTSEKKMVERLFKRESQLRQAQAVVDWLEQVHFEDSRGAHNKNNPEVIKNNLFCSRPFFIDWKLLMSEKSVLFSFSKRSRR